MKSFVFLCVSLCAAWSLPSDENSLLGVVVDERGGPVKGAEIWVSGTDYPQPKALARAKTDADGRFHLKVPNDVARSPYAPFLFVWARGSAGRLVCSSVNVSAPR